MNTNPPTTTDTVSQSEIERLLAEVSGTEQPAPDASSAFDGVKPTNSEIFQRHEFPKLSVFSGSELRKLRMRHEVFIASLAARLSIHLGMEINLQMSKLEMVLFQKFTNNLSNPTHLTLLKLEPLVGTCLLDIPPHLGLCVVDRELGGPGVSVDEPRDLGKIETRLLARVVETIVSEWCSIWSDVHDLRPVLLNHENNGRFVETCAPDTTMLVLGITTSIGQVVDQIQFAFPYFTLEPLIAKLNSTAENKAKPAAVPLPKANKWNPVFGEIDLRVNAEMPALQMTTREIADWKPGDFIPLPAEMASQIRLCVAESPKFVGILGTISDCWAVKISEVLNDPAVAA